jgi:hypothetical protein
MSANITTRKPFSRPTEKIWNFSKTKKILKLNTLAKLTRQFNR